MAAGETCPYDAESWKDTRTSKRRALLEAPALKSLDDACFVRLLEVLEDPAGERTQVKPPLKLIREYLGYTTGFGLDLLFAALRHGGSAGDSASWAKVCTVWVERNGKMGEEAKRLSDAGELKSADSLYAAFDAGRLLSTSDFLAWVNVKTALGDYVGAARVLCALSRYKEGLSSHARGQLSHMFKDVDREVARAALLAYRDCYLALPHADTLMLRGWLEGTFSRYGLFDEQLRTLVAFDSDERPVGEKLVRLARRHLAQKRYAEAAWAARLALPRIDNRQLKNFCITALYESYRSLGKTDSAALWLERSPLARGSAAGPAVVFYQDAGMLARADSLLRGLKKGTVRDSLEVRQLLLEGQVDSAAGSAGRMVKASHWREARQNALIWVLRTGLYTGNIEGYKRVADSLAFDPSWDYAAEVLRYRYWYERLKADPAALRDWGPFEYALYRGSPASAASGMRMEGYAGPSAQMFVVRLVREFLARGDLAAAARQAQGIDVKHAVPAEAYYCAEILVLQGELEKAVGVLERLILEHPGDIYSSKARLLLLKVQS
jgi:hypothetical protein